jgi:putative peptidoglycan lipid II flippase
VTPRWRRAAGGLAGAAALIAAVTVVARAAGFGRYLVFSRTVGDTCLGTAYLTANQVPNVLFEVVAGGALASVVVPVVAAALAEGDPAAARRSAAALLTWTVAVLAPVALVALLLADPLMNALVRDPDGCPTGEVAAAAARMLQVFVPQIVLYGVAVVLSGVLQAHRRFLAPALAPLVSSVVVVGAYLAFAAADDAGREDLSRLARPAELILSVGTTLGVLALVLTCLPALRGIGAGLRPTSSFPPGAARRVRSLALSGLSALLAQQASVVAVLLLANGQGPRGALAVYSYAWAIYLLPYAVLAVPIATSAFPVLAGAAGVGAEERFARVCAATTRAVLLVCAGGSAVLAAAALPVARVFVLGGPGDSAPVLLAYALVAFAPGLVGYGLVAHLSRALYARGRGRSAAGGTVLGWAAVVVADVALVRVLPGHATVAALGLGNTVGMSLSGAALLVALRRAAGPASVAGVARAGVAGLVGALVGYAAGVGAVAAAGPTGILASVGLAAAAAVLATAGFAAAVLVLDGADLRAALTRRFARD